MQHIKPTLSMFGIIVFFINTLILNAQPTQIYINEFLASNKTVIHSPIFSEYADWIEIANFNSDSIDLGGYYLTDDLSTPMKWRIPTNTYIPGDGYLIFWADGRDTLLHTNFKLSKEGEMIGLFTSAGAAVDTLTFGLQYDDVSYGRFSDNILQSAFFTPPSPGYKNTASSEVAITSDPQFSIAGGFYSGQQSLTLSDSDSSVIIRYTIDGTPPDTSSLVFISSIIIDSTTAIRARAYQAGKIPSRIKTCTYFINEAVHLPVISLVTDPKNFFDDMDGIYVTGKNGIVGNCDSVNFRNLNQDWERPVNIEFYETTGEMRINQGAGVKIYGGCSRTRYPQKSLAIYARGEYGKSTFDYQLFPSKPMVSFETFLLRSSADDQVYTMFRDGLAHILLWLGMGADIQAYRPVAVFLNGVYWGIHNIREKVDEHYLEENFHLLKENVNLLGKNPYEPWNIKYGSAIAYNAMMDYIQANDMSSDSNYNYIKTQIDIDRYIDYQIGHIYLAVGDWPSNNIQFWNANSGKYTQWRWINHDLDLAFYFTMDNTLATATEPNGPIWPNPPWSTLLFRKLLECTNFKNEFIQRYAYYLSTIFKPDNVIHIVDSLQANIASEIPRHISRWGGKKSPDTEETWMPPTFNSVAKWESNVEVIRSFCKDRPQYAVQNVCDKFSLSGIAQLTLAENMPSAGKLKIMGFNVPDSGYSAPYFKSIPLTIEALPVYGYRFAYWTIGSSQFTEQKIEVTLISDTIITANYAPSILNDSSLIIINEINYNSSSTFDTEDWVELYNRQKQSVDLSGWILKDENDSNPFIFALGTSITAEGYIIVCNSLSNFQNLFPAVNKALGSFTFGFKSSGEVIRLFSNTGTLIDSVHYGNKAPWPTEPNGAGASLELKNSWLNNDLTESWAASTGHGTPGSVNSRLTTVAGNIASSIPRKHELFQNYPNPFNPLTMISFTVGTYCNTSVRIYDILGREVAILVNENKSAGSYQVSWDASGFASGMYFCVFNAGAERFARKMLLLK